MTISKTVAPLPKQNNSIMATGATVATTPSQTSYPGGSGPIDWAEFGVYTLVFIVGIIIVIILFSRKIIALIGGKKFFILIAVSVILNMIGSFITSCFGSGKKKENFEPALAGMFILVFTLLVLTFVFYYYLIKFLGFKNYLILLCVISLISSVYGWSRNCI